MAHDEYGCACCQANLGMLFAYDTVDPQCAQIQILPIGRRRFIAGASAAAGLAALSACGSSAKSEGPLLPTGPDVWTRIYSGGTILAVDTGFATPEAIAIRGDRILATGSLEEVTTAAGDDAELIDLAGRGAEAIVVRNEALGWARYGFGSDAEVRARVAEAMAPEKTPGKGETPDDEEPSLEFDATMTWSQKEILQGKDFEQMSREELIAARREIGRLRLPIMEVPTRRFTDDRAGRRIDMRRTLRRSLRGGGAAIDLARKKRVRRHPPLVILCDISGSMSRYSRMLLLFMHAVTSDRDRVHSFVFGTRLTNVTRHLRHRDVDIALEHIGEKVQDWSGGTRIGHCLETFNRDWSRRVLGQGPVVLLITDGLDRDAGEGLAAQIERLHKSCRRLIWLNPLLRFDGYQPISTGARALIRHVDDFRSVHNLASLADLVQVLGRTPTRRTEGVSEWLRNAERT